MKIKSTPLLAAIFSFFILDPFSRSTCSNKYWISVTFHSTEFAGPVDLPDFSPLINSTSDNDLRVVHLNSRT